jgi:type II secretory pathway pseudopilin PulG
MAFQNPDAQPGMEEAGPPPEESSNRPFLIVAGILGGILLLSLLCIAAYAGFLLPRLQGQRSTQQAAAITQNYQIAQAATQTINAMNSTPTATKAKPTDTPKPAATNTPVVAVASPTNPTAEQGAGGLTTATLRVIQTTAAALQQTQTPGGLTATATGLPNGGWADEVGAPALLLMGIALVAVIFLARRLRTSGSTR